MRHMLAAADAIGAYVARGRAAFAADEAVREAIVFQIIVLGEAAKAAIAADPAVVTDFPELEWAPMARMRDKVTHHYWDIDQEMVWATAAENIPLVREQLRSALG